MNRYQRTGRRVLMTAIMVYALAGYAAAAPHADTFHTDTRAPAEQQLGRIGNPLAGHLDGWPEAVPVPEGVQIDGYRCSNRYCRIWFGLMNLDQAMALKRSYTQRLKDSGKWEQLGSPGDQYENEAYRYTGAMPSGCGYTLEISQGAIPNDYHRRYRVFASLTW